MSRSRYGAISVTADDPSTFPWDARAGVVTGDVAYVYLENARESSDDFGPIPRGDFLKMFGGDFGKGVRWGRRPRPGRTHLHVLHVNLSAAIQSKAPGCNAIRGLEFFALSDAPSVRAVELLSHGALVGYFVEPQFRMPLIPNVGGLTLRVYSTTPSAVVGINFTPQTIAWKKEDMVCPMSAAIARTTTGGSTGVEYVWDHTFMRQWKLNLPSHLHGTMLPTHSAIVTRTLGHLLGGDEILEPVRFCLALLHYVEHKDKGVMLDPRLTFSPKASRACMHYCSAGDQAKLCDRLEEICSDHDAHVLQLEAWDNYLDEVCASLSDVRLNFACTSALGTGYTEGFDSPGVLVDYSPGEDGVVGAMDLFLRRHGRFSMRACDEEEKATGVANVYQIAGNKIDQFSYAGVACATLKKRPRSPGSDVSAPDIRSELTHSPSRPQEPKRTRTAATTVKAFKATHAGGKPLHGGEVYEVGKTYTLEGTAKLCAHGYHASQRIDDVLKYNENLDDIYEVTISGSIDIGNDKICGTVMVVERQLPLIEIVQTMEDKDKALCWAARKGHKKLVELLFLVSDPRYDDSRALRLAAGHGHKEIVELLIPVSDPKARESQALRWAALKGHKECVELLLPVSDPKANSGEALCVAAAKGHKEIVELLIPLSDLWAWDSQALRCAAANGYKECVELLIPVSDPAVVADLGLA